MRASDQVMPGFDPKGTALPKAVKCSAPKAALGRQACQAHALGSYWLIKNVLAMISFFKSGARFRKVGCEQIFRILS